jgi:hypothetical protein
MKKEKSKLYIEKVAGDVLVDDTPQTFQYMPKLCLEVIENKRKIKPSVVNKPYVPSTYVRQHRTSPQELDQYFNKLYSTYYAPKQEEASGAIKGPTGPSGVPDMDRDELTYVGNDDAGNDTGDDVANDSGGDDTGDESGNDDSGDDAGDDAVNDAGNDVGDTRSNTHTWQIEEEPAQKVQFSERIARPPPPVAVEDGVPKATGVSPPSPPKQETPWDAFQAIKQFASEPVPHYPVDISRIPTDNNDDLEQKYRIMHKFDILKMGNKDHTFPECSIHMDYKTLKKTYDSEVLKLHIHNSLHSNRKYLIGGFILTEYVFGYYCGFDMKGFTQQQILAMSSYDRLLIELGEKTYAEEDSNLPVEVRLIGLVVVNAALFLFSKLIMKNTGTNAMNFLSSFNTASTASTDAKKKHMRGPRQH